MDTESKGGSRVWDQKNRAADAQATARQLIKVEWFCIAVLLFIAVLGAYATRFDVEVRTMMTAEAALLTSQLTGQDMRPSWPGSQCAGRDMASATLEAWRKRAPDQPGTRCQALSPTQIPFSTQFSRAATVLPPRASRHVTVVHRSPT